MKRSVNIKYFLLIIFFVFNSFSVSTSIRDLNHGDINTEERLNKDVPLVFYSEETTARVNKKLDSLFTRYNKRYDFHGSVIVAKKGKVIFKDHYGYADFKNRSKIDDSSIFQLASVSKQFTAAAVLILYEEGKLELDDKVTRFYPDFPYPEVTIRQLLNHTSGLPKYFWLAEHKWDKEYVPSNKEMMKMMSEHDVQRFFSPGANFDYSNTGYFVLASVVEKVTGSTFGEFVQDHIFDPLFMNNTFVYRYEKDELKEGQLNGYRVYRRRWHAKIGGTVNDGIVGDKNVYSTTEDMMKWVQGLNSGKIISKKTLEEMYTRGETKYKRKVPYGFGFRIKEDDRGKVVYHNGKWNGFSTSLMQYTDEDLVVITLEHSNYNSMKTLNQKIKKIVDQNFNLPVE
ncbi:serine hydrolase domain-containing protein [Lutimonas zeaxanthinifaciens]|uniref:serine hydrolase domain-containing protein n=1 Tax=Lutimonas zeaxanthinifaciens TaxID=3060215 RepID=UPI00265CA852|nr:serine hydrolase domain-containing protein [Lutimonas sp. YSD2104]WKK67397.1 serine hydrolase domain-containing protein [Lutimonas sp. YSD2104]